MHCPPRVHAEPDAYVFTHAAPLHQRPVVQSTSPAGALLGHDVPQAVPLAQTYAPHETMAVKQRPLPEQVEVVSVLTAHDGAPPQAVPITA